MRGAFRRDALWRHEECTFGSRCLCHMQSNDEDKASQHRTQRGVLSRIFHVHNENSGAWTSLINQRFEIDLSAFDERPKVIVKIILILPLGTSFHDLINLFTRIDMFVHQFGDVLLRPSLSSLNRLGCRRFVISLQPSLVCFWSVSEQRLCAWSGCGPGVRRRVRRRNPAAPVRLGRLSRGWIGCVG